MTMPTSQRAKSLTKTGRADDNHEALHWLQMARRVLAGQIAPHEARRALDGGGKIIRLKAPQAQR